MQTIPLKRGDQIVRQPDDFQAQRIGRERGGGNLAQGEIFAQFGDPGLHAGTALIEVPDAGGRERHVGDPGAIDITPRVNSVVCASSSGMIRRATTKRRACGQP